MCTITPEEPPVVEIDIPEAYSEDPCNEPWETNNASWIVPDNTDEYYWAIEDGELIVYAEDGYVFTDGSTSHNFGAPTESGEVCDTDTPPELIHISVTPTWTDECNIPGEGPNSFWHVPANTAEITWELTAGGELIAHANEGYVFEGGEATYNFGTAPDNGEVCDVPPTVIHTAKKVDPAKPTALPRTGSEPINTLPALAVSMLALVGLTLNRHRRS